MTCQKSDDKEVGRKKLKQVLSDVASGLCHKVTLLRFLAKKPCSLPNGKSFRPQITDMQIQECLV